MYESIEGLDRSLIAPLFGMRDTANMVLNLRDMGHLLTSESLERILYLHSRRSVGASVVFSGETGCGKSQNLKLYSALINADCNLYTNLRLHLLSASHVDRNLQ